MCGRSTYRQAERAVSRAPQPRWRGPARQLCRALRDGPAAPVLPHHRDGTRHARGLDRGVTRDPQLRRSSSHRQIRKSTSLPRTIPEYLDQLKVALAGADPALLQRMRGTTRRDICVRSQRSILIALSPKPSRKSPPATERLKRSPTSLVTPRRVSTARYARPCRRRAHHAWVGFSASSPSRERTPLCSTCCGAWRPELSI